MNHHTALSQAPCKIALAVLWMMACLGLLKPGPASAKPTSENQARQAVAGWLDLDRQPLGAPLTPTVNKVATYQDSAGQAAYHIVYLAPAGLVIVGGDDLVEPIVGFLPDATTYDPSDRNPVGALVSKDLAGRVYEVRLREKTAGGQGLAFQPTETMNTAAQKWSTLTAAPAAREQKLSIISDVRVAPFLLTTWDQSTVAGQLCYNYYTPNNYVCGCVATAMAQLMRFHSFPTVGVGTTSFPIHVGGVAQTASLRGGNGSGGAYSWAGMPVAPTAAITLAQRQAIGTLTRDAGVSVEMYYDTNENGGSGTDTLMAADRFKSVFKYTNAVKGFNQSGNNLLNISATLVQKMTNPNLDAGWPVLFGIFKSGVGGHAIVCDGYGYNSSTMYHHLNMGWSGDSNVWYNLPNIDASIAFNTLYKIVYNVYTSGTGEIISGRVTTTAGAPISGATVTANRSGGGSYSATTNAKGIYALKKVPSASSYSISVTAAGSSFTAKSVTTGSSTNQSNTCGNVWGVNFTAGAAAPALAITQATGLTASGNYGGPFSPVSAAYTVRNTGSATMAWTASKTKTWLTVSPASGSLAAGASVTVTVSINSTANTLAAGVWRDTVSFTNATNGSGNTTRPVTLTINGVTQTFTIYNDGAANLTVNSLALDATAAWITWDAVTPFTVAPGGSKVVKVYVTYAKAPTGSATRRIVVGSNDPARNPYPGGVTIVTNNGGATPAALTVTPATGLTAAGNAGGPFSPASASWVVKNTGGSTMAWTASKTKTWLTLSPASGSLAAGASVTVTATINPQANTLATGSYSDTVTIKNATNNVGNTTRAISLTVGTPATLSVTPATGLTATGKVGGPFSPASALFTLKNTGTGTLAWTASKGKTWLTLSPASGSLAAGAAVTVTATINPQANTLVAGGYTDTIGITNATNARGNTTRPVTLTVSASSWALATGTAAWPARYGHSLASFISKLWLLGGTGSDTGIWSSIDGVTWSRSATNGPLNRTWMGVTVFNNKLWVSGGQAAAGTTIYRDVWSSTNGVTWTRATATAGWAARHSHQMLAFGGKLWVLGGSSGGDVYKRDVWSSIDGITWTQVTATANWAGMTNFAAFDFAGRLWVVGDGASGMTEAWNSTTGSAWTRTSTIAGLGSRYYFSSGVLGGKMWVMGGMDYADTTGNWLRKDLWGSADGINWTKSTVAVPWSARYGQASAVFGSKLWLTGGNTSFTGNASTRDVYKYTN